jgi:polysaccharide export outer membrane protein
MKTVTSNFITILCFVVLSSWFANAQELNPGDGVRLIFLDVTDDISGDYYIQSDGKLQLPIIGILSTFGRKFPEIKSEIFSKYSKLYKNPELTILSLFRINILGEVNSPGFYYATEEQKLRDIFALADGVTGAADLDDVYIIRNNQEIELDVESIMLEGDTASDIGLRSGDQIYVTRSFWADPGRFTWIFSAIAAIVAVVAIFISR